MQETRGDLYLEQAQFQSALDDYRQFLRSKPRFTRAAVFHQGLAHAYLGDQVVVLYSYYSDALRERCRIEAHVGRLQRAQSDCTEALQWRPGDANALDYRGLAYLRLGKLDAAIGDYGAALQLAPRLASALFGRALAEHGKGNHAAAQTDEAAAHVIEPSIDANNFDRAADGRCQADLGLKPPGDQRALECHVLLAEKPDDAAALEEVGFLDLTEGHHERAIDEFTAALKREPSTAAALYGRGLAEHVVGHLAESRADVAAALQIDPSVASPFDAFFKGLGMASPLQYTHDPRPR